MNDGILLENGKSRLMRATLPATYEEFVQACAAGTQLLDIMFNSAGWQTQPTFLSKGNLLSDAVSSVIGLPATATVNDAIAALAIGKDKKGLLIRVLYPDGTPAVGYKVSGAQSPLGEELITDNNGYCVAVSDSSTVSVSIPNPEDIDIAPSPVETISLSQGLSTHTIQLSPETGIKQFTTSLQGYISHTCKTVDFCGVGAGGGGAVADFCGSGGGGGAVVNKLGVQIGSRKSIAITIGAPGKCFNDSYANKAGTKGGDTTVTLDGSRIVNAVGGNGGTVTVSGRSYLGGTGNGNGGNGSSNTSNTADNAKATDGTGNIFNDPDLGPAGGGGGGGGVRDYYSQDTSRPKTGGAPNGADGAAELNQDTVKLNATTAGIGGGGGGAHKSSGQRPAQLASDGGPGLLYARFNRG